MHSIIVCCSFRLQFIVFRLHIHFTTIFPYFFYANFFVHSLKKDSISRLCSQWQHGAIISSSTMAIFTRIIKVPFRMMFKLGDAANLGGRSARGAQKQLKSTENIWWKPSASTIISPTRLRCSNFFCFPSFNIQRKTSWFLTEFLQLLYFKSAWFNLYFKWITIEN